MNKKELKNKLAVEVIDTVVQKPYTYVHVSVTYENVTYWGRGFAKWNMLDKKVMDKAEKLLKRVDPECCEFCEAMADFCVRVIEKFKWSEERGIEIATGRAVKNVVKQIMEKSNAGQIDFDLSMKMSSSVVEVGSVAEVRNELLEKIMNAKVENG